jgi:hypothetical protein
LPPIEGSGKGNTSPFSVVSICPVEQEAMSNSIARLMNDRVMFFIFFSIYKNIFPSINFGRVRGMFMAPPYNVVGAVAPAASETIQQPTVGQERQPFG